MLKRRFVPHYFDAVERLEGNHIQDDIRELLSGPLALERNRLTMLAMLARSAGGDSVLPQARVHAATPTALRRRPGHGAIAVLPFYGICAQRPSELGEMLGLVSIHGFTQAFRAALADDSVGGILIDIDSPGGSVYGVMELADEIYRSRARKPIAAIANSLAASGAFWVASAAGESFVTPGAKSAASASTTSIPMFRRDLRRPASRQR